MSYMTMYAEVSFPPSGLRHGYIPAIGTYGKEMRNEISMYQWENDNYPNVETPSDPWTTDAVHAISCQWEALRKQLLLQWGRLSRQEIDRAGPWRDRLAVLIHNKYGISTTLAENYLHNFERVLPLM